MIRFTILGPLRAWRADTELELGSRQQRLILALLLAHTGRIVSVSELVGVLWENDPPASAVNVVHRHIGLLRRIFEPSLSMRTPGTVLHRDHAGYRLRLDDATLDLIEFRDLVGRARRSSDAGVATELFGAALQLWHGRCADGLDPVTRTHPAFVSVDAECRRIVVEAADIALRTGDVRAVAPALRLAVELEPLDEALQARFMLTLGAEGRQSEALTAFDDFRTRLARDLGVEPGVELRDAYDRLRHQRGTGPAAAPSPDPPIPARLPSAQPYFSGRCDVIAEADRAVQGDGDQARPATMVVVDGLPGMGKTTLAVQLAHRFADRCPDGQFHVDLRGFGAADAVVSPVEALQGLLGAMGVAESGLPAELHALAGLYRSILAERRMLVLLDNCRDWQQTRHLLPGTGPSLVIATSRRKITTLLAGAHRIALGPMTAAESRDVLARRLGPRPAGRDASALATVADRCAGLPLALVLVASRILHGPGLSVATLARELAQNDPGATAFDLGSIFSWSYQALSPAAADLFRRLPLHPGPDFSVETLAALGGVPIRTARSLILELDTYLLVQPVGSRWRMHDVVRAYAADMSERIASTGDTGRVRHQQVAGL
jgi:DNA-binding SARP family transcriptional activator